jgi:adiponectin receptor
MLSLTGVFLSLLLGAAAYATSWPEKQYPETFDLVGSSHQIMHVCIAAAHIFEAVFVIHTFRKNKRVDLNARTQ